MRYLVVLLVGILVLACVPGFACAQGYPSSAGVGVPSPGCALAIDVGYLGTGRRVALDLSSDPFVAGMQGLRHEYPINGLWLGLSVSGQVRDRIGVFARGWWLFPSFESSTRTLLLASGVVDSRNWETDVQWYKLDIGGTYSIYQSLTAIGGFRFDSFMTTFDDRDDSIPPHVVTDEGDVTLTSYIPYAGFMVTQGSALKAGLIGFPYVPASVKYSDTYGAFGVRYETTGSLQSSYFLEAFAEYARQYVGGQVSLFGAWTFLHGKSELDGIRLVDGAPSTLGMNRFSVDRQNWILGAKFQMDFLSPI